MFSLFKKDKFIFTEYKILDSSRLLFSYAYELKSGERREYGELVELPVEINFAKVDPEVLHETLETLHLLIGISYYKIYCGRRMELPYALNEQEANFFNKVYKKGLGEFLFRNNLDLDRVPTFKAEKNLAQFVIEDKAQDKVKRRSLLGLGGGKDSIVAAEILKSSKKSFDLFVVESGEDSQIINEVADLIGEKLYRVKRNLDPQVFEKNNGGFNGHVPISAINAGFGVLLAVCKNYENVIVANEFSSNFGNVDYQGQSINHQWSKSQEFESLFNNYLKKQVSADIRYFSLLRPFYELRIVEKFSHLSKYFDSFSSCNRAFKISGKDGKKWCGECAKCVFAFTIFSAFIPQDDLLGIFGKNLYQDKSLEKTFADILGFGEMKPFDCVGTFEESRAALWKASDAYKNDYIVKKFLNKIENGQLLFEDAMRACPAPNLPTEFKLDVVGSALVLGYAREGKATEEYLKKNHPKIKIGIADQNDDPNYLDKQKDFDLIIRTPAIPPQKITGHSTTAFNIFMSQVDNLVIGITGSKGKSTTSSLIYEIIKASGKKVLLLGNIGNPALHALTEGIDPETIIVFEMSSFMLEDAEKAPHIAVVTNLSPGHMDHHGSAEKYYADKMRIGFMQNPNDYFIYRYDDEEIAKHLEKISSQKFVFDQDVSDLEIPLLGEHNVQNVRAAMTVARILGIERKDIHRAVKNFKSLPHRLEYVGEFKGIKFYDDAIASTPEAAMMALKALDGVETIFVGGKDYGWDFSELEEMIHKSDVKNVVLFPEAGRKIITKEKNLKVLDTRSMEEAVKWAYEVTTPGKICLLSCGCPSFSIWKNFEEKGDLFKKYVKDLGA